MKNLFLLFTIILLLTNCKRSEPPPPLLKTAGNAIAAELVADKAFNQFSAKYISTMLEFSNYQKSSLGDSEKDFIFEMRSAADQGVAEKVYGKYGVDFDRIIQYQNELDNALLTLYIQKPELADLSVQQTKQLFTEAISLGLKSDEQMWVSARKTISVSAGKFKNYPNRKGFIVTAIKTELTPDEIWGCIKDAVGLSLGSQVFIKGMQAASVKILTTAVTKLVSRFAGPIGVALLVAEFGFCMYEQVND